MIIEILFVKVFVCFKIFSNFLKAKQKNMTHSNDEESSCELSMVTAEEKPGLSQKVRRSYLLNGRSRSKNSLPIYLDYQTYFKNTKKYEKEVAAFWRLGIMVFFVFTIGIFILYKIS